MDDGCLSCSSLAIELRFLAHPFAEELCFCSLLVLKETHHSTYFSANGSCPAMVWFPHRAGASIPWSLPVFFAWAERLGLQRVRNFKRVSLRSLASHPVPWLLQLFRVERFVFLLPYLAYKFSFCRGSENGTAQFRGLSNLLLLRVSFTSVHQHTLDLRGVLWGLSWIQMLNHSSSPKRLVPAVGIWKHQLSACPCSLPAIFFCSGRVHS